MMAKNIKANRRPALVLVLYIMIWALCLKMSCFDLILCLFKKRNFGFALEFYYLKAFVFSKVRLNHTSSVAVALHWDYDVFQDFDIVYLII